MVVEPPPLQSEIPPKLVSAIPPKLLSGPLKSGKNQQQNANLGFRQAKEWAKLLNTFCTSGMLELELLHMVQVQCYEDTRLMKFPEVAKLCESVGGICGLLGVVKDWLLIAYSLLMITDTITPLNLLGYLIAFLGECHLFRFVHFFGGYNMENLQEQFGRGVLTDPYIACVLNCMLWIFYGLPFNHPNSTLVVMINGTGLMLDSSILL
ncbi:hypothetical protein M8C21_024753 [Ambrosia artemisiifolia]|uniref:Uncharacterized protein n=1 Tax=Ambrosia artemisiifolia TaxID=4212 RepID=A0AAD5C8I2_AMBAR|nr:hypothetical protein M8C21_024753 [Ambrosia artemisiifolia]